MGLVDDEQTEPKFSGQLQSPERAERGHGDTTVSDPPRQIIGAFGAVELDRGQRAVGVDLVQPVQHAAGRDHDQAPQPAGAGEVRDDGDRFDRLAEPHFVAEDRASA
ncbi:hypothetical protein J2S41_004033 [Catenuloplanes atrovinosus]|uniref:Uncharacterized protein n=1 Tax=Catenuloplanes atrovinosus TaxID=137266 RepID=A0AAE3YRB4_9ACTN|nr:hypothetical protein [Catenuloplanes atrovinosus]MDR7277255.1 hypothetical protein [Catenuloplanes atrovinosus]